MLVDEVPRATFGARVDSASGVDVGAGRLDSVTVEGREVRSVPVQGLAVWVPALVFT